MVIATKTHVAVTINLHRHIDADALVVPEGLPMVCVIPLDLAARVEPRHHHRRAPPLFIGDGFHLLKLVHDDTVVEIFPRADPAVVRLRLESEPSLKLFRVFLRGLRVDPPRQIENLRIGVLAGEFV